MDFQQFEACPEGFTNLDSILSKERFAPEPELLSKAREEFSERADVSGLAALRLSRGLSQIELARLIGTSQSRLSLWERGSERPSLESFARLGRVLEIDHGELLGVFDV